MRSSVLTAVALIAVLSQLVLAIKQGQTPPLTISTLPVKLNHAFTFKIFIYPGVIHLDRSHKTPSFKGNFSTLHLLGAGLVHQYTATSFTFKYPPQHRIATDNIQAIEMQIMYTLSLRKGLPWKHRELALSVNFVLTEYAPSEGFTFPKESLQSSSNGIAINFTKWLPLVPGLSMFIYKGLHSDYPDNKAFLWLVRKQLLLMSTQQFKQIIELIYPNAEENHESHGLIRRLSDLNQIQETKEESFKPMSTSDEL